MKKNPKKSQIYLGWSFIGRRQNAALKILKEAKKKRVRRVYHESLFGSDDGFDVFQVNNNGSVSP